MPGAVSHGRTAIDQVAAALRALPCNRTPKYETSSGHND
jgi:hypothetical protein